MAATRGGMSINAAAKISGINYRTALRTVQAAVKHAGPGTRGGRLSRYADRFTERYA